jgi:hypothetical protein
MAITGTDWSAWGDEDDDLQKALRASLLEAEAAGDILMNDSNETGAGLEEEVSAKYNKVISVWERQRRILWYPVEEALQAATDHLDHRQTQLFMNQMIPQIVDICVRECSWADIVEDQATKEDFSQTFENILRQCLNLIIFSMRYFDVIPLFFQTREWSTRLNVYNDSPNLCMVPSCAGYFTKMALPKKIRSRHGMLA